MTTVILLGIAGGITWLVAGAQQKPSTVHVSVPQPKVTHTTIVQHITHVTHVTRAAATHIPDGMWVLAVVTVVAVLVYYLARGRNHD